MALEKELFTRKLTNADSPFVVGEDDGITSYTINLVSGVATILGTRRLNNLGSNAVNLVIGQPFNNSANHAVPITITIGVGAIVDFACQ